jgi:hypothetical protein
MVASPGFEVIVQSGAAEPTARAPRGVFHHRSIANFGAFKPFAATGSTVFTLLQLYH